jgi:hypothetical protein
MLVLTHKLQARGNKGDAGSPTGDSGETRLEMGFLKNTIGIPPTEVGIPIILFEVLPDYQGTEYYRHLQQ